MRAGRRASLLVALTFVAAAGTSLSAHRRDEYLQAARIAVEPDRVELELDLTPGIAVADAIVNAIDRDRDGSLSSDEQRAYAASVRSALTLDIDSQALRLEPIGATFPGLDAFRRGEGTIRLQWAATLPRLSGGDHQIVYRNAHRRDVSVYLANALVPRSDRIAIAAQRRDPAQHELAIAFVVGAPSTTWAAVWLLVACGGLAYRHVRTEGRKLKADG